MAFKKLAEYKDVKYSSRPSDRIDPKLKKEKDWYIANLSYMINNHVTNRLTVPYNWGVGQTPFPTLRAYMEGKQGNISVKKKLLLESDEHPGKFKTKLRDVFQVYDVLPEFIDVIRAINQKNEYEVGATAIDEPSLKTKSEEKGLIKMLLQKETQDLLQRYGFKVQSELTPEDLKFMTEADVDVLFDTGGYQLAQEIAAVACCNKSKLICNHKEIENKVNDDLITLAIAAIKSYTDLSTSEVKYRYVDPAQLLIPYSQYNDFRDITWAAELRTMTIAEVKEINPNLTAKEIAQLVEDHLFMNKGYESFISGLGQLGENGTLPYQVDQCKVLTLDAQWLSADYKTYLDRPTSLGGLDYRETKYDYKIDTKEKKKGVKIDRKRIIKKYTATWIVGTDILLQYGEANNVNYYGPKGNKTPRLDYFIYKTGSKSLVERCIPHVDDINLNNVKMRISVASLPPAPRMIIQQQMLNNVRLSGIKQSPEDLVQTLLERGYLVVNGLDDHGRPIYQNGKAIDFINSGLAEDINTYSGLINDSIQRMRQVLGLPEGLDGTSAQPYQGVRTQEMAASASSNALFPTLGRIGPLFKDVFTDVVDKWKILAKDKNLKIPYRNLGEKTWKILQLTSDFSNSDYNIELSFAPTDEQKQFLLQTISQMSADYTATGGTMGASKAEFLMLYKLIQAGSIDQAMFRIAQIEKRKEMQRAMKEQRDIEANMQANEQATQTAQEEQRRTVQLEESEKRKTEILKGAQARKTSITGTYLKSFDGEMRAIPQPLYDQMMADADGEIASVLQEDQQPQNMETAEQVQMAMPEEEPQIGF